MASERCFIKLEEHFMIPELMEAQNDANVMTDWHPGVDLSFVSLPSLTEKLKDLGEKRIEDMQSGKIQIQLLSHAPTFLPNEPTTETCHKANEAIYEAIKSYPLQFGGMVWLNMRDQEAAVKEISLRISQGFKGIFIDDHTPDGVRYDDPKFWKVFEMAEKLDVPVYLHPTYAPSIHVRKPQSSTSSAHCGSYTPIVAGMLSSASLGWHSETAIHVLRLFSSGLFERFSKLKLILGHDGEGLPFFFHRIK